MNEQTSFTSVVNDITCIDNLPLSACPVGYNATVASCSAVPQCGCCVCTPASGGKQVFASGDMRVSNNFCTAFCSQATGDPTHQLIPGLTAAQCSGQIAAQTVSGRVTDQSGNPIVGATVTAPSGSSVTDNGGFYTIGVIAPVTTLNISKSGISTSIQVDTRIRTTGWNVSLTLAARVADLYGKVTPIINNVPSTTPIPNTRIKITDGVNTFNTMTDAVGEYRFIGIPLATYQLTANKCAYFKKQESVTVSAPTTAHNILLQPAPKEIISGTVRDTQNRMIEDVDFIVSPPAGVVTKSDANGRFLITDIDSNCQYSIKATKTPQYSEQSKVVNIYADDFVTTNPLNFVLAPGPAFNFCADIGDCRGEDMRLGSADDCGCPANKICNALTGECDARPIVDCCDFTFQCQPQAAKLAPTPQCAGKTTCANTCAEIIDCPVDEKLSNANVDGVCECSGQLVSVTPSIAELYNIPLASGKYCCPYSSTPITNMTCQAQSKAIVFGTIVSKITQLPIDAAIHVDGSLIPIGYSDAETGEYEIYLTPNTAHTIQFRREPLYLPVIRSVQAFNLKKGVRYRLDAELRTTEILCNYPTNPPVPEFAAEHVKCKPEAKLVWDKDYCRNDIGVQSFAIANVNDDKIYLVDKDQDEFIIKDLEWGETYDFTIQAVYADSNRPRASDPVTISFSAGDADCAGQCDDKEFCLSNTQRRICDNKNKLSSAVSPGSFADCAEHKTAEGTEADWFCAGPNQQGKTVCLMENQCGYDLSSPVPFLGLLFNDLKCSRNLNTGKMNNGCYLDRSTTTVDFCYSCPKPDSEDFNCYTYDSKYACENNRCNLPGDCRWVPTSYFNLGEGICYDYNMISDTKYDQIEAGKEIGSECSECSKQGDLFGNIDCEQDACSKLGLCYSSDEQGTSCFECSEQTACSDFKTRESCISATGEDRRFNLFSSPSAPESAQYSDDACGLGVCAWNEVNGTCYKDGNADGKSDCVSVQFGVESFNSVCARDTHPPTTTPNFDTLILNNMSDDPENIISFNVTEPIERFNYCLHKEGETECTGMYKISGTNTEFVKGYTISFNPVNQFRNIVDSAGNYKIRYFSEDMNKNVELLKETVLYIDPFAPQILIQNSAECLNCEEQLDCYTEDAYVSQFIVSMSADEISVCQAYLIPPGETRATTIYHDIFAVDVITPTTIIYAPETGLPDGNYRFVLECEDIVGNKIEEEHTFKIDSFNLISDPIPTGPVKELGISYDIDTSQVSNCYISIDGREDVIMDQGAGAKRHTLGKAYNINTYHSYRVKCIPKFAINPNRCDTEYYDFAIDNAPPKIKSYINGNEFDELDWTLFMTDPTDLVIIAEDKGIQNSEISFGIDHIAYCTRDDLLTCDPATALDAAKRFGESKIIIPVDKNIKVCYYAVDKGGNKGRIKCGKTLFTPIPDIAIDSPTQDTITDDPRLTVTALHDVSDATEAVISAFDGENSISVSASIIDATVSGTLTSLFPGLNIVYARIKTAGGMWGEDSVDVYYDTEGPVIELTSDRVFEYGDTIEVEAEIVDTHWTAVETPDGSGDVTEASAVIQSMLLTDNFTLLKAGKIFSQSITPILLQNNLYNYLPGEYLITINAKDRFGNIAVDTYNISIVDTSPTEIDVGLDDYGTREENTFYTTSTKPKIQVTTTEPATCELHMISSTPILVEDFWEDETSRAHEYESEHYLEFDTGSVQIFNAMILCTDLFGGNVDEVPIRIVYDDVAPDLALFSTLGTKQIEKEGFVYEITEPGQYGVLSTLITARDLRDNEEIICEYTCNKDENESCDPTTETRAGFMDFGMEEYNAGQIMQINVGSANIIDGEYRLDVNCTDKALNAITKDLVLFFNIQRDMFKIIAAGPSGEITSTAPDVYVLTNLPTSKCEWDKPLAGNVALTPATDKRMNRFFSFTPSGLAVGNYSYTIECAQFDTGNTDSIDVDFSISATGGATGTYVVKGMAALYLGSSDTQAPMITNIDLRTNNGKRGIYVDDFRENYKRIRVLEGGDANNNIMIQLTADAIEAVVCRYSEQYQNFAQMENEFYSSEYAFYPKSPFIKLTTGTSKRYYVSCRDSAGNTAAPYTVELSVDFNAPVEIIEASPVGYVNQYPIIKTTTVQDVDCVYDTATSTNNQMKKYDIADYYGHTSALFPGSVIVIPEEEDQTITVSCGSGVRQTSETITFALDKTLPTLTITSPEDDEVLDTPDFELRGSTEIGVELDIYVNRAYQGKVEVLLDGTFDSTVSLDTSGENVIDVIATDKAGNKVEKSITVTTTSDASRVVAIFPSAGLIGDLSEIVAVVRGERFSPTRTIFDVSKDGETFSGNVIYDSEEDVLAFKSTLGYFPSGNYEAEVIPVDSDGMPGFVKRVSFTVDVTQPRLRWISPSSERAIINKQNIRAVVELQPISNRRVITQADISASSDGLDFSKFDFVKKGDLYYADLSLAEGVNYIRIDAADLPGTVHHTRTIVVDLRGASAVIEPSGTITTSRPTIIVQFSEDVELVSFSLTEFGNGDRFTHALELSDATSREFTFDAVSQLLSGSYTFSITVKDINGNEATTTQNFVVDIGDVVQKLVKPKNMVAPGTPFNLILETNQDANCRYSRIYDPGVHSSIGQFTGLFGETGGIRHTINEFTSVDAIYPATNNIYIWCEGLTTLRESQPVLYAFSIDKTAPRILDAYVEPDEVAEYPLETELFVETDEPAICKYECNSATASYDFMDYALSESYEEIQSGIIELEDNTMYLCNIVCANLAGLKSAVLEVSFNVDTSLGVGLRIIKPKDGAAYSEYTVPLKLKSENIAECEYSLDGEEAINFPDIGQSFEIMLENLSVGKHEVTVDCIYSTGDGSISSTFYIDDTPPSETVVNVGDVACSSENIDVTWEGTDSDSGIIEYEVALRTEESEEGVYDVKEFTSVGNSTKLPQGFLPDLDSERYVFGVKAMNRAGLWGEPVESLVFLIDPTLIICIDVTPPEITLMKQQIPAKTTISLSCDDGNESGCNPAMLYGIADDEDMCVANQTYLVPIEFTEQKFFCYWASDLAGNVVEETEIIVILPSEIAGCPNDLDCDNITNERDEDIDGDGIPNCVDPDDDNDGIVDYNTETNFNEDFDDDNDGINDDSDFDVDNDLDNDGLANGIDDDIDCDGILNCDDPDMDNDGLLNDWLDENNGLLDSPDKDNDNDGTIDVDDPDFGKATVPDTDNDLDNDGILNSIDDDIDGDGILNEEDSDWDNDGVPNCMDIDIDNDGRSNSEDPDYTDDFDEDGMPNDWEEMFGLDKLDSLDKELDNDNDGLINADEFQFRTDPNNKDSDNDGYTDYDELFGYDERYDPTDPESKPPSKFLFILVMVIIILLLAAFGYYGYKYYLGYQQKREKEKLEAKLRARPATRRLMREVKKKPKPKPKVVMPKVDITKELEGRKKLREERRRAKVHVRERLFGKFGAGRGRTTKLKKPEEKVGRKPKKLPESFRKLDRMVGKGKSLDALIAKRKGKVKMKEIDRLGKIIEKRGELKKSDFDKLIALSSKFSPETRKVTGKKKRKKLRRI